MAATKGVYGESRSASCHRLEGKQISVERVHGVGKLKLSAHTVIYNLNFPKRVWERGGEFII